MEFVFSFYVDTVVQIHDNVLQWKPALNKNSSRSMKKFSLDGVKYIYVEYEHEANNPGNPKEESTEPEEVPTWQNTLQYQRLDRHQKRNFPDSVHLLVGIETDGKYKVHKISAYEGQQGFFDLVDFLSRKYPHADIRNLPQKEALALMGKSSHNVIYGFVVGIIAYLIIGGAHAFNKLPSALKNSGEELSGFIWMQVYLFVLLIGVFGGMGYLMGLDKDPILAMKKFGKNIFHGSKNN
ncbi:MAG: hypothetical protein JJT78_13815 [Leptospira sp.]|nr:hypothetical protein [Leptospira sp.]